MLKSLIGAPGVRRRLLVSTCCHRSPQLATDKLFSQISALRPSISLQTLLSAASMISHGPGYRRHVCQASPWPLGPCLFSFASLCHYPYVVIPCWSLRSRFPYGGYVALDEPGSGLRMLARPCFSSAGLLRCVGDCLAKFVWSSYIFYYYVFSACNRQRFCNSPAELQMCVCHVMDALLIAISA
jgi:hypothetical protein